MDDYIDTLKEFYQNKMKIKKNKSKKTISEIEIEKIPYYFNKDYLKFLENKILEEKSKILIAKYNLYYDLGIEDSVEVYEQIEQNIKKLNEERDKIKFSIERKEDIKLKHIKKLNDEIDELKINYSQLPDMIDKKIIYKEIEIKREEINLIHNNDRCIILEDINKKKIFVVTPDYNPINGNEILASDLEIKEPKSANFDEFREDGKGGANGATDGGTDGGVDGGAGKSSKKSKLTFETLDDLETSTSTPLSSKIPKPSKLKFTSGP